MQNHSIDLARRYIERTNTSLFLTGKAGTGKTTFLRQLVETCPKRHVVVAPTGVAAVNAGGVTIHSFFQLPFDPYLPEVQELTTEYQTAAAYRTPNKNKLDIIRTLELLIIDEISMVRADLLDAIDMTLRRLRRSSLPFGGVQLLMIGDVHQLPPVVTEQERPYIERVYASPFFFNSKALARMQYVTIELTHVYRQQDAAFVQLLNNVRDGHLDPHTISALNARLGATQPNAITLTTHNSQANIINQAHMQQLHGQSHVYEAIVQGNYPDSAMPAERTMLVKEHERVMFIKNDSSGSKQYYNGKTGTVVGFCSGDDEDLIEVQTDDGDGVIRIGRERWENVKYEINKRTGAITKVVDGTFLQYPLRPAWAITIHKAQGLTFDRVSIDAADAFAFGQVYVALSRCRTLEGLSLTTPLSPSVAITDTSVQQFCSAQPTLQQVADAAAGFEEQYYYQQLTALFNFGALHADCQRLQTAYAHIRNLYPKQYEATLAMVGHVAEMRDVGERFARQLLALPRERHAERIAKAATYFAQQLSGVKPALAALLHVDVDNNEHAKQLKEAGKAVDERLGVKIACIKEVDAHGFSIEGVQRAKNSALLQKNNADAATPKSHRNTKSATATPSADDVDEALLERLKAWRAEKAALLDVKPFVVLQQRTLLAIAAARPTTIAQLKEVPGMGKTKTRVFGEELLSVVNAT